MKHLITCLALGIAFAAGAQTGLVEFPYNPDANNDDVIGINDLLELLSLFGGEFAEENLYVNESETSAIYHIEGSWLYGMCAVKCRELPSNKWRIMQFDDWTQFHNEIESPFSGGATHAWLLDPVNGVNAIPSTNVYKTVVQVNYSSKGYVNLFENSTGANCFCATHERPKVEYSYCRGEYPTDPAFQDCANEKVTAGWYPIGGIETDAGSDPHQAFWRWAE
ncbi:hypothetical protein N9L13_07885 [Flavobacteriales bacterium]|nr:hypothetical protein [Flavobacteriales bacterium]